MHRGWKQAQLSGAWLLGGPKQTSRHLASPPPRWLGAAHPEPGPGPRPTQVINNAILASVAAGRPVMVNSHTSDDYKGRLPRFWAAEGPYRPTPAGLGTYGFNYPPQYTPRERAISLGNVTETLMQALRVGVRARVRVRVQMCMCKCMCSSICSAPAVHLHALLPCRLPPGSSPLSRTPTRRPV